MPSNVSNFFGRYFHRSSLSTWSKHESLAQVHSHIHTNSAKRYLSKWPESNVPASGHCANTPAASDKRSSWLSSLGCPRCKRPFATDVTPSASSSTHDSNLKQVVCNRFLDCFPSAVYIHHSAPSPTYFLGKEPSLAATL